MFIDKEGKLRKPLVYLADFEMFLPTCEATVKHWKEVCEKYGLIGYFPGDGDPVEPGDDYFARVFAHDCHGMDICDMCIAQLDDWRGHGPDSGTVFEAGYFIAQGKPVYGFYGGKTPLREKGIPAREEDGCFYDEEGFGLEDKGLAFGQMFTLFYIGREFDDCCARARADFDAKLIAEGYEPYKM